MITQIWDIKIDLNLHRLFVIILSYYLESFKKIVQLNLQIYALVQLQTTYLQMIFVFKVISQIWDIKIDPNLHRLFVINLSYYLESFKKIVQLDLQMQIYALVPLQTTYLEIFFCV